MFKKICIFLCWISFFYCQEFGINKVQYKQFKWQIYKTKHFDIFHYTSSENITKIGEIAEDAYDNISNSLKHYVSKPIPLILYLSHNEFEQTNVSPGLIGEGVGGFTTLFLKERIAMPIFSSQKQFKEVLTHELTHIFTLDAIENQKIEVPLWLMEGLAEYGAQDWDSYAEMILRDAFLFDRILPFSSLIYSFSTDSPYDVFLAYKQSQSIINFIADKFGKEKFILFFRGLKDGKAFSNITSLKFSDIEILWYRYYKNKYNKYNEKSYKNIDKIAINLTPSKKNIWNIHPVVSPDGKKIIYISDKSGENELYYTDLGFKEEKSLTKKILRRKIDYLSLEGRSFCFSPDSKKIAFIAEKKGENCIFIQNIENAKIEQRIELKLNDIESPCWSPDGQYLVFIGLKEIYSDLYSYNLITRKITQLTFDEFDDNSPLFSHNGNFIVYTKEIDKKEIFLFNINTKESFQLTNNFGNNFSPIFTQDDKKLLFTSDKTDIINLYQIDIETKETVQLTDITGGVFSPTISSTSIFFSYYSNGKMDVYKLETKVLNDKIMTEEKTFIIPPWQKKKKSFNNLKEIKEEELIFSKDDKIKKENRKKEEKKIVLPELRKGKIFSETEKSITEKDFTGKDFIRPKEEKNKFKITFDKIYPLIYYDSLSGIIQAQFLLIGSDILGDRYIIFSGENSQITNEEGKHLSQQLNDINFSLAFYSFKHRINYVIQPFNWNNYYYYYNTNSLQKVHEHQNGVNFLCSFPFDRYNRLETGFIYKTMDYSYIDKSIFKQLKLRGIEINLVKDITSWDYIDPVKGFRGILTTQLFDNILNGDTEFSNFIIDIRQYWQLFHFFTFCYRIKGMKSIGRDYQFFFLGGPDDLRAYNFREFMGSDVLLLNSELRFPILKKELYFAGVLFFDSGATSTPQNKEKFKYMSDLGTGFRFTVPGSPLLIRCDWAWPINNKTKEAKFYIYFNHMF